MLPRESFGFGHLPKSSTVSDVTEIHLQLFAAKHQNHRNCDCSSVTKTEIRAISKGLKRQVAKGLTLINSLLSECRKTCIKKSCLDFSIKRLCFYVLRRYREKNYTSSSSFAWR